MGVHMKEIKKIRKYLLEERNLVQEEIDNYTRLEKDVQSKIEHSSRYVLSVATSTSDSQNIFSPYGKNKSDDLEEENLNIENLNNQAKVVQFNLNKLNAKMKSLDSYLDELEKFTENDYYFIDKKKYDVIQDLLSEFLEELENATEDFEKNLKKFMYVDPHRIQMEFQGYKKKVDELTEKIQECETILSDNRRENR